MGESSGRHIGLKLRIRLQLVRHDEGGRRGPVGSGYRPWLLIQTPNGAQTFGMCEFEFDEPIAPGSGGEGNLSFERRVADLVRPFLSAGTEFAVLEGARVVGTARVISIDE